MFWKEGEKVRQINIMTNSLFFCWNAFESFGFCWSKNLILWMTRTNSDKRLRRCLTRSFQKHDNSISIVEEIGLKNIQTLFCVVLGAVSLDCLHVNLNQISEKKGKRRRYKKQTIDRFRVSTSIIRNKHYLDFSAPWEAAANPVMDWKIEL